MEKEARLKIFKTNLTKLIIEGKEGSYVIFDTPEKFVQFAGSKELGLLCDMPLSELSKAEKTRLLSLEEFSEGEGATIAGAGEFVSFQICFQSINEIDKAVELTERVFTEVFRLPENYDIKTRLNLER